MLLRTLFRRPLLTTFKSSSARTRYLSSSTMSAKLTAIHTESAPGAIGPYSQAVVANGMVFCSGQIPLVPSTMQIVEGDVQVQT
ncbi:hypothetical protein BC828DRAFT_406253, partial [Blastocladiella britannica]